MKILLKKILLAFVILLGTYFISVFLIPYITIRAETIQAAKEINIYIKSNGVHTDVIVPIKNQYYNWYQKFSQKDTKKESSKMKYVAIGWGDKGFYLDTPTWADLTLKTALRASLGLSTTALHTTYYDKIVEDENCVQIKISAQQYKNLCDYICESAKQENSKFVNIKTQANYGLHDAFYEAKGTYHLFKTCNTWTNTALKISGQKACLWTVTDHQILIKNK
ncbi:TIGR02117 family protein [Wenyingzhuangia sp. IMCC45533]